MNDNQETRLIVVAKGDREYAVPVKDSLTWAQRYPGSTPPEGFGDLRFWPTPDGWVIARPIDTDQPGETEI